MLQRHKREVKVHKELAKKMGKKRKDEAAALESAVEERHAQEVAALEARGGQDMAQDAAAVSVLADSLYTCRVGGDETKPTGKQTRAQKRRGARAAEEAEREARIAEEQASQGPSDRATEARELQALLDPLRLVVRDIPADGHCLYRAVEDQLLQCGAASEATGSYPALRARVAAHMREHAADYAPFVLPEDAEGNGVDATSDEYEQHCRDIEETAAWGGQVELGALAALLQRRITVYSVGMPAVDMGPDDTGPKGALRLCYLRHAFGLGEHYNSVQPKLVENGDDFS
ncbi:hypothetical protein WJX81_005494 [Elliptochloris bilobata]|uniref:OTU domain-containing protein n=1 Tax=Elliptochloris bilobata TaxID=381761 RepID=A0AAW1QMH1_9CHLO